jgi:hypothetical protein
MLAKPGATLPAGAALPGGVYEPKWDGYLVPMCGHITDQYLLLDLIHQWPTSRTEPREGHLTDGKREAAQRRDP